MSARRLGRLIVLEGIDGSGTTTQARLLGEALGNRGHDVVVTREPTAGPVGVLIRQALQGKLASEPGETIRLDFRAMALLFAADRVDHNQRTILPALAEGRLVIGDRYTLSSLLYQSLTAPEGTNWLPWLNDINSTARIPDLTVVLDTPAAVAAQRREQRGGERELYEVDDLQQRLAAAYAAAEQYLPGQRLHHVDGSRSPTEVLDALLTACQPLLG